MIQSNLSKIKQPIQNELDQFEDFFKASLKSKIGLVDLVTKYILKQKGKKIRPVLVLLSAKVCGGITERSFRGAVLIELLHTATLVHDDVVDNAEQRRGLPSINAIWKNKIAVLMGDYLLARGLMLAVDGKDYDFLGIITNTVKRMSEGELLQIRKTRKFGIDEQTYFSIISDKTASLITTCCEVGAKSATDDEEKINALRTYGENLGMAFQIRDDILDFIGSSKIFGKSPGQDIREKKLTLPLIYTLKNASKNSANDIIKLIKNGRDSKNIDKVIDLVKSNGGIQYAEQVADEFINKAKKSLDKIQDSESKAALSELLNFVVARKS